jgi:hypothetical protein
MSPPLKVGARWDVLISITKFSCRLHTAAASLAAAHREHRKIIIFRSGLITKNKKKYSSINGLYIEFQSVICKYYQRKHCMFNQGSAPEQRGKIRLVKENSHAPHFHHPAKYCKKWKKIGIGDANSYTMSVFIINLAAVLTESAGL